jgi:integrase/recombinase XerD
MKLAAAIDFFLSAWPSEGPTPATVRDYTKQLTWFRSFAAERGVDLLAAVTPALVRAAVTANMDERRAHSPNFKGGEASAAQFVAAVRKLTSWLALQGVTAPDLSMVRAPRVPERVQPRLTWDEFERMQRAVLERFVNGSKRVPKLVVARDLALINMLAETGLRATETVNLTVRDVDFNTGLLTVRRGKGKKERTLSIVGHEQDPDPLRVLRLLEDWVKWRTGVRAAQEHQMLWISLRGNPLSADELRNVLGRICLEAGIDSNRSPHAFRRFQFSERYRAEPQSLQRLVARMGWSPKSHTMPGIYTRGVEMDFSRDRIALLTNRVGLSSAPPPLHARLPAGPATDLAAVLRQNPAVARALSEALRNLGAPSAQGGAA